VSRMSRMRPVEFSCEGDLLSGILHSGAADARTGVVIVVGGPQTRIGSHRQFLLLANALAAAGHPCLRFDYRGMGDSEGEPRDFEAVDADIRAAVDAFRGEVLLVLSGRDLTAAEFRAAAEQAPLAEALGRSRLGQVELADANHTFSSAAWRAEVEQATMSWLAALDTRN